MIDPKTLVNLFIKQDIKYFTGVPDSVLNHFIKSLVKQKGIYHNPTINEGSAIALGAGYYLATKKIPLIYLQNSGLCNALNPLLSLMDEKVFSIPQIILVGRRGAPGIKDEPQHAKIGPHTLKLLKSLDFTFFDLNKCKNINQIKNKVNESVSLASKLNKPIFLIVNKKFFNNGNSKNKKGIQKVKTNTPLRIDFLERLLQNKVTKKSIYFSSLGNVSRELFYLNTKFKSGHNNFFYSIGGMGHVNNIAAEYKKFKKNKNVIIVDGDGSVQMQLGNLLKIGETKLNLLHIIFDNACHESTGGHNLGTKKINYKTILKSMGYKHVKIIKTVKQFENEITKQKFGNLRALIVSLKPGTISNLPRPDISPKQLKEIFIN